MDQKLKNKLKKAQGDWKNARSKANETVGFAEVPDGRYLAHLTGATIGESDDDTGSDEDVEDTDGGVPDEPEESDEESDDEEPDDEGEDDGDDEQEVEVGMRVIASTKKGDAAGEIVEIIENEGKVRVSLDEGRTVRISVDKLEAEPVTTPPKKARKRPQ